MTVMIGVDPVGSPTHAAERPKNCVTTKEDSIGTGQPLPLATDRRDGSLGSWRNSP